jgi:hypothetical protein
MFDSVTFAVTVTNTSSSGDHMVQAEAVEPHLQHVIALGPRRSRSKDLTKLGMRAGQRRSDRVLITKEEDTIATAASTFPWSCFVSIGSLEATLVSVGGHVPVSLDGWCTRLGRESIRHQR